MRESDVGGANVYPDSRPAADGILPAAGRNKPRLAKGRGNTTERQRKVPPQCGQARPCGVSVGAGVGGPVTVKPCANSMRPFSSSIGIEELGDRKPK